MEIDLRYCPKIESCLLTKRNLIHHKELISVNNKPPIIEKVDSFEKRVGISFLTVMHNSTNQGLFFMILG